MLDFFIRNNIQTDFKVAELEQAFDYLARKSLDTAEQALNNEQAEIQRRETALADRYRQLKTLMQRFNALKYELDNNSLAQDKQYLLNHPGVIGFKKSRQDSQAILFTGRSPVRNYEAEVLENYMENQRHLLWTKEYAIYQHENQRAPSNVEELQAITNRLAATRNLSQMTLIRLALKKIFLDCEYTLLFANAIFIHSGESPHAKHRDECAEFTPSDAVWNPHLKYYDCFGNYSSPISKAFAAGDYIQFVETCLASIGSINFYDTTVFEKLINLMDHDTPYANMPCIARTKDPHSELISFVQLYDIIKEEQYAANQTAEGHGQEDSAGVSPENDGEPQL